MTNKNQNLEASSDQSRSTNVSADGAETSTKAKKSTNTKASSETLSSLDKTDGTSAPEVQVLWDTWEKERRKRGHEGRRQHFRSRLLLRQAIAMAAIEYVHRKGHDWDAEAKALNLEVPKSQHPYMLQATVTFGVETESAEEKQRLSGFNDRNALAIQWAAEQVAKDPLRFKPTDDGIEDLAKLLQKSGGITDIANLQREKNGEARRRPTDVAHEAISLDSRKSRSIRIAQARKRLHESYGDGEIALGLIVERDGSRKLAETITPDEAQIEEALLQLNVIDPLIDQMGELLHGGKMIVEESTEQLRDQQDDPEDPERGFRKSHRHTVLGYNEWIIISPILSAASVVVFARPFHQFLPEEPTQPSHLRTRERRIMEVNLSDPARRSVFTGSWGKVGKTKGVHRFVAKTEAAFEGEASEISVLVEPLKSREGNLPLMAHLDRLDPQFSGEFFFRDWKARHKEFVVKIVKPKKKGEQIKLFFQPDSWKVAAKKKNDERGIVGEGSATVSLVETDFRAVSEVIATLPVQGNIRVKADRDKGIVLDFRTHFFDYQVVIPSATAAGERNGALFGLMKVAAE